MLTPVDIQQKKFHVGLGYDKKDVNTFFDSVSENYESLYRSNAELKEKVSILNDTLQNYRSKESHLGSEKQNKSASVSEGFGAYTGDPQMRDESTLGGFNGGYGSGDITSTSAVYTQSLSAGENFVDPFKPQDQKDYNPFNAKEKTSEDKKSSLKVAN